MRVALVFDMEGTSHIGDIREPFPMYREYWETGRAKLTNDVVAATRGLLEGGATEVWVVNHHGAGDGDWPNVIVERLPDGARMAEDWGKQAMRDHVDAMFQVGAHARGGSPSFLSHTIGVGMRLRLGGELLSESHWWAWTGNVPLLGMVGSEELGEERGSLGNVPFLAVQRSIDRATAHPVHPSPAATSEAIEAFAKAAMQGAGRRRIATPPGPIRLEASVQNPDEAASAMAGAGWQRTSRTEFAIEADAWRSEGEPVDNAIYVASDAAFAPYGFWFGDLDATSEEAALAFPEDRLARSTEMLLSWSADRTPLWFEPLAAGGHWEGFQRNLPQPSCDLSSWRAGARYCGGIPSWYAKCPRPTHALLGDHLVLLDQAPTLPVEGELIPPCAVIGIGQDPGQPDPRQRILERLVDEPVAVDPASVDGQVRAVVVGAARSALAGACIPAGDPVQLPLEDERAITQALVLLKIASGRIIRAG